MKKDLQIVIIGGGLGGAATALALQEKGIQAHIYEQASTLGEVGAAIIITSPTQDYLYEWGAGELLEKYGTAIETIDMFTAQGQFMTSLTYKEFAGEIEVGENVRSPRLVHRARILEMLLSPIPDKYVHLDHQCEEIIEHEDYVEIRFVNGEVVKADVVIAADGIHSKARKLFSDDQPLFAGGFAIRLLLDRALSVELSAKDRLRLYQDGNMPVLVGTVGEQIAIDMKVASQEASWSLSFEKEELMAQVKGFDETLLNLLDKAEYPVIARGLYHRKPIERWSTNRITLLGDSAHAMLPTLGQGANSAIQDAGVLAMVFTECDSIPEALRRYENIRRPITTAIQNGSTDMEKLVKA